MALVLLRIARRSASLEEADLQTLFETEFSHDGQPDLRLSVYEIADEHPEIVRTYAQHAASAPNFDPPLRRRQHFNVSGLQPRPPVPAPMNSPFAQLRASHREVPFAHAAELRRFVEKLQREVVQRGRLVTKQDAEQHVRQRLLNGDAEWETVRANRSDWNDYLKRLIQRP